MFSILLGVHHGVRLVCFLMELGRCIVLGVFASMQASRSVLCLLDICCGRDVNVPGIQYSAFQLNSGSTIPINVFTSFCVASTGRVGNLQSFFLPTGSQTTWWGYFTAFRIQLSQQESRLGFNISWIDTARMQRLYHQQYTAPLTASKGICEIEWFWLLVGRKSVRGSNTTWLWRTIQLYQSTQSWTQQV